MSFVLDPPALAPGTITATRRGMLASHGMHRSSGNIVDKYNGRVIMISTTTVFFAIRHHLTFIIYHLCGTVESDLSCDQRRRHGHHTPYAILVMVVQMDADA